MRLCDWLWLGCAVTISTPVKNGLVQQAIDTTFGYVVSAYVEKEYVLPEGAELTAIGLVSARFAWEAKPEHSKSLLSQSSTGV